MKGQINSKGWSRKTQEKGETENVSEALNSIHRDVMDLRKESDTLKIENVELKKNMADLESRVNDQERYS